MTGKIKIIVSSDEDRISTTKKWEDSNAVIHFRDHEGHTLILDDNNIYYLLITSTTIEAESLLIEADAWKIEQGKQVDKTKEAIEIEFRFNEFTFDPSSTTY